MHIIRNISGEGSWVSIASCAQPYFTDTMSVFNKKLGMMNSTFRYRVRARNECGWSVYSLEIKADLIDKISCQSSNHKPLRRDEESYYGMSKSMDGLLPHGISLRSESDGNLLNMSTPGETCRSLQNKTKKRRVQALITDDEKYHMMHEDMLSVPQYAAVPAAASAVCSSGGHTKTFSDDESESSVQGSPQKSKRNRHTSQPQAKYGHDPVLSTDSSLAGESLEGVNSALETWLCRLAEACPLDENGKKMAKQGGSVGPSLSLDENEEEEEEEAAEESVRSARRYQSPGASRPVSSQSFKVPVLDTLYTEAGMNPKQIRMKQPSKKPRGVGTMEARGVDGGRGGAVEDDEESIVLKLARTHIDTHGIKEPAMVLSKLLPNKMFTLR
jgi:hypothetical protein